MDGTIRVAKAKALISFTITAKLICVFVFVCKKKKRFSHNEAHLSRVHVHNLHPGANLHPLMSRSYENKLCSYAPRFYWKFNTMYSFL